MEVNNEQNPIEQNATEVKTPTNFDEAAAAAKAAAERQAEPTQETQAQEAPAQEAPAQQPVQQQTQQTQQDLTKEQKTAEIARLLQSAQSIPQLQQQISQLQQQLQQSQAAVQQQSQAAQQQIENTMLEPPKLDMSDYAYLSDDERAQRETEYSNKLRDYTLSEVNQKIDPLLRQYEQQQKQNDRDSAITVLKGKFPEIDGYMNDMDALISSDNAIGKALQNMPAKEQYASAYLLLKGSNSLQPQQPKAAEQIVDEVTNNPDAMRMLELKRAEQVKGNSNIPAQSASAGMANVPVTTPNRPKNFDEAEILAKKALGIR